MTNPRSAPPDARLSAAESVLNASMRVTASYLRLLAQQQKMLANGSGRRRAGENGAKAPCGPGGACLTDGYGRRCTDVDVERL